MTARIHVRPSRFLSIVLLSAVVVAATAVEARATCTVPGASKASALTGAARLARPGIAPALAVAAQNAGTSGSGAIVGQWQVLMIAFPGTNNEFVFDFGFQQFHADGTELMISGGVPTTIGNVCIGIWERQAGGVIRLRHMAWNWTGNEVLGDLPTGYFLLEVTLRVDSQGTAYSGTWKAVSFDLGTGPLGSGGPPQPNSEYEGTLQAAKVSVQ